jgi:hypothetical protein
VPLPSTIVAHGDVGGGDRSRADAATGIRFHGAAEVEIVPKIGEETERRDVPGRFYCRSVEAADAKGRAKAAVGADLQVVKVLATVAEFGVGAQAVTETIPRGAGD